MATYAELLPQSAGSYVELMAVDELKRRLKQSQDVDTLTSEVGAN